VTWRGRAFQVRAAVIGKARSPTVYDRRTGSDGVDTDRSLGHVMWVWKRSAVD